MRLLHRTVLACVALSLVGLGGCVENRGSVTVSSNLVPNADCTADPGSTEIRTSGRLDLSELAFELTDPRYVMWTSVTNNLISTKEGGSGAELNIIEIVEARIDLDAGSLQGFEPLRFVQPIFVTMGPGDSAGLNVVVIPPQIANLLKDDIQGREMYDQPYVRVRLKFLYQLGGLQHETQQIEYAVALCNGCLIDPGSTCDSGLYTSVAMQGNPCSFAQDMPMQCCRGSVGGYVCPAQDTSTLE
jgi:hypothetical protein